MARNLVVCCDGTNNQFGGLETNVVHLYRALAGDAADQWSYYEPGVGTFGAKVFGLNVGETLGKTLGSAFGYGITQNLARAYRFLIDVYEPGDRLFIFGFSRGAFTARSLAALVDRWGVLAACDRDAAPATVKAWLNDGSTPPPAIAAGLRRCEPHFVGVWDTVGALGLLLRLRRFHDNRLSPGVATAIQALAIDERRAVFKPTLWDERTTAPAQRVEQRWFAGVHGDVGGGYADRALADITLGWMLDHARSAGLRLARDTPARSPGDPAGRLHVSYTGLWRLLGYHERQPRPAALFHASVGQRLRRRADYDPENLAPARRRTLCADTSSGSGPAEPASSDTASTPKE